MGLLNGGDVLSPERPLMSGGEVGADSEAASNTQGNYSSVQYGTILECELHSVANEILCASMSGHIFLFSSFFLSFSNSTLRHDSDNCNSPQRRTEISLLIVKQRSTPSY